MSARRALAYIGAVVVVLGTLGVTAAAFALSYDAIRSVGIAANVRESWAWMLPVSVDGAMAVATVAVLLLKQIGRSTWYPWLVVGVGFAVSAGCNALHSQLRLGKQALPTEAAVAVSVVPPLMLILSVELLAVLTKALSAEQVAPTTFVTQVVEPRTGAPERTGQAAPATSVTAVTESRTDAPEQTEQAAPTTAVTAVVEPRTGRTEQAPAPASRPAQPATVRKPAPRPVRTEQVADLREQTGQATEQTGEQDPGQDGGQAEERPRPDEELIAILREQAAEQIADGKLTRYRVEKITGASARQADRLLDKVLSAREQDSEQADLVSVTGLVSAAQ